MALTQDPERLIEAAAQFTGAGPSVNTFKVTADLCPSLSGRRQKGSRGGWGWGWGGMCKPTPSMGEKNRAFLRRKCCHNRMSLGNWNFLSGLWSCYRSKWVKHLWIKMPTWWRQQATLLKCQVRASAFQQKGPKIKSLQQLQQLKVKIEKLRGQNAITAQVTFKCFVQIIRSNAILRLR